MKSSILIAAAILVSGAAITAAIAWPRLTAKEQAQCIYPSVTVTNSMERQAIVDRYDCKP